MKPLQPLQCISLHALTILWISAALSSTLAQSSTATPKLTVTASGSGGTLPVASSTVSADISSRSTEIRLPKLNSSIESTTPTIPIVNATASGNNQSLSTDLPKAASVTSTDIPKLTGKTTPVFNNTPVATRSRSRSRGNSTQSVSRDKSKSIFSPPRSFGQLCEEDNDEVGRKLGCDCLSNYGNNVADCSNRQIKIGSETIPLPAKLNVSSHITMLDLSDNLIQRIDESSFNDVSGLTELNLSRNRITFIDNLNAPRLTSLDLSFNGITNLTESLFKNSKKILHLDLSHNSLTFIDIATFTTLEYLQSLKLGFNPLDNIHNYMEIYPFILQNMTHLEDLDLTNGSLPGLPDFVLQGTTNLKRLILKNNLLSYLPTGIFSQLPLLEVLDLSGNYFEVLPSNGFSGMPHLKTLFIDRGRGLERIEEYAFSGLSSLALLSCENNYHLNYIDVRAFRGNPKTNESESNPKDVRLSYNNLNHFEYPLLKWSLMEALELFGNPWQCDCNLQWVSEFSRQAPSNASVLIDRDFICEGPPLLKGIPVTDIDPDEMYCESPVAMLAGIIAIAVLGLILTCFVIMVVLYKFNILPKRLEKFVGVLKDRTRNTLPKYSKVQPKPSGIRHHRLVNHRSPEVAPDLDWDTGDIGHLNY